MQRFQLAHIVKRAGAVFLAATSAMIFSTQAAAARHDITSEGSPSEISDGLKNASAVVVNCGQDVSADTCKFFTNSLDADLRPLGVGVMEFYAPEVLVQSFYVPPRIGVPPNVSLRLIDSGTAQSPVLNLGGFYFSLKDPNSHGVQLPRWSVKEPAQSYGTLESARASAAKELAHEFTQYWEEMTQNPGAASQIGHRCNFKSLPIGMTLEDVRAKLGSLVMDYRGTHQGYDAYYVSDGACYAFLDFSADNRTLQYVDAHERNQ